jgi:hypothetical protein
MSREQGYRVSVPNGTKLSRVLVNFARGAACRRRTMDVLNFNFMRFVSVPLAHIGAHALTDARPGGTPER